MTRIVGSSQHLHQFLEQAVLLQRWGNVASDDDRSLLDMAKISRTGDIDRDARAVCEEIAHLRTIGVRRQRWELALGSTPNRSVASSNHAEARIAGR